MPRLNTRPKLIRAVYWAGVVAVLAGVALRFAAGWPNLGVGLAIIGALAILSARVVGRLRL